VQSCAVTERATIEESTTHKERAKPLESTKIRERATIEESTTGEERAIIEESTTSTERIAAGRLGLWAGSPSLINRAWEPLDAPGGHT
jgi:hypothetical protein